MKKFIENNWYILLAGIMLLLAIPPIWSYSYYQILRWVVVIVASYNAFTFFEKDNKNWMFIMIAIAVLFNPITSIHLEKQTWVILDLVASIIMFISIRKIKK